MSYPVVNKRAGKDRSIEEVELLLKEQMEVHLGMLQGEPVTRVSPEDADRKGSRALAEQIRQAATENGAVLSERSEEHKPLVQDFHRDGGFTTVVSHTLSVLFGSTGAVIAFLKGVNPLVVRWLENQERRSVTLKKGKLEVTLKGSNDIEAAIKALQALAAVDGQEGKKETPKSRRPRAPKNPKSE